MFSVETFQHLQLVDLSLLCAQNYFAEQAFLEIFCQLKWL